MTCKECRHVEITEVIDWELVLGEPKCIKEKIYHCHCNPPILLVCKGERGYWSEVYADDFCGEFRKKAKVSDVK